MEPNSLKRIRLYLLAGIGTAPAFMKGLQQELYHKLAGAGYRAEGRLMFPYGDWGRRVVPQIREVWHDVRLPLHRLDRSIGGRLATDRIALDLDEAHAPAPILLVGHSGGGTAALHAAGLLRATHPGCPVRAIVQIGSPRSPIPPELSEDTAYCYSARENGRRKDPVCRVGSWRSAAVGTEAEAGRRPIRLPGKRTGCPPGTLLPLPLQGGHPDYFRTHLKDAAGRTNFNITLEAVWGFIRERLGEENGL